MKERVSFISNDPKSDFDNLKENRLFYVVPDPDIGREGYIAQELDDTDAI